MKLAGEATKPNALTLPGAERCQHMIVRMRGRPTREVVHFVAASKVSLIRKAATDALEDDAILRDDVRSEFEVDRRGAASKSSSSYPVEQARHTVRLHCRRRPRLTATGYRR